MSPKEKEIEKTNMENNEKTIKWLLEGDVSIQYQVHRDLLGEDRADLRNRISTEGWGAKYLSERNPAGHWGTKFYHPKWTSTHYSIMDLKNMNIAPDNQLIKDSISQAIKLNKGPDGGILPSYATQVTDGCINGMVINYATYFGIQEEKLESIIDCILNEQIPDGGFNCRSNRGGAVHSSVHTTISILEGFSEFIKNNYNYRREEIITASEKAREFLLEHRLYKSDKTGEVIEKRMTMLSYPSRWRYDFLRALDYFQSAGVKYDRRMQDALDLLKDKQRKDSTWPVQAKHPGQVHFNMEKTGGPSRWNTLRAIRVLKYFKQTEQINK